MTQVAVRLLPEILRADLPRSVKIDALFHLLSNAGYALVGAMCLTMVPTLYRYGEELAATTWHQGWMRRVAVTFGLGLGLGVAGGWAALRGLFIRGGEFVRTPKGRGERAYRLDRPPTAAAEVAMAVYQLVWIGISFRGGRLDLALLASFFFSGYAWFGWMEWRNLRSTSDAHPILVEGGGRSPENVGA
jgi:hypothetical protein